MFDNISDFSEDKYAGALRRIYLIYIEAILAITCTIYEAFENVSLNKSKVHQLMPLDKDGVCLPLSQG